MAAVDCRGRVAERAVLAAVGWAAGTRLEFRQVAGVLLVRAQPAGVFEVTAQGHLRLPASVRRCCGLSPGDRVLLAADAARGVLAVYPPAALDALLAAGPGGGVS
jgi:bifunctional DNA-binding transcriptional regulator/antitoxin component of YhaV-PrlF toxin-antitoxin module